MWNIGLLQTIYRGMDNWYWQVSKLRWDQCRKRGEQVYPDGACPF